MQLAACCRELRLKKSVGQVLIIKASAYAMKKQCSHLLRLLKSDIRALHKLAVINTGTNMHLCQLEETLKQASSESKNGLATAVSAIMMLLELKSGLVTMLVQ